MMIDGLHGSDYRLNELLLLQESLHLQRMSLIQGTTQREILVRK